jgi:glycosyltransferase involved in cell wall biosynthesis
MVGAYPTPGAVPVGGPQVATTRLVSALGRCGVEITVVAPSIERREARTVELGERLRLIEIPADGRWSLVKGLRSLRRRVRVVIERLDADLVHAHESVPYGLAAADAPLPRILTAHGSMRADTVAATPGIGGISRAYVRDRLSRLAVERADVVIGVNPAWNVNLPCRPKHFVYIPNIVDGRFYELERVPEPGVVLFAGGTRTIKGWPLLAAAWPAVRRRAPEAHLLAVGWSHELMPGADARQDSMTFEGWLSPDELADRMARASVLVIPSEYEVSPIILAEAWALGLPVVTTAVGGMGPLAEGAAILASPQNPPQLAQAVLNALAAGDEVNRFVEEGRRRAERHRAEAVAHAHIDLYEALVRPADASLTKSVEATTVSGTGSVG